MRAYYSEPPPVSKRRHNPSQYRVGVGLFRVQKRNGERARLRMATCELLMASVWLRLSWRKLGPWGELRGILLSKAARLLSEAARLLSIELSRRGSDLYVGDGLSVIRSPQQHIRLVVHHRVVDEHPLVVSLLLVIDSDGRVFTLAGHADNRASAERLAANTGVAEDRVVAAGLARSILTGWASALAASRTKAETRLPLRPT